MQLFYAPEISEKQQHYTFDKIESKHISRVLRKKEGDVLDITNGKGWLFKGQLISADPKNCTVEIIDTHQTPSRKYYLHLAVAPTKMNDRYEWFLEKATEIGIDEITPIICDHSERKVIKKDRYEKIIHTALKQSLQTHMPVLNEACNFSDFVKKHQEGQLFIAHCSEQEKYELKRKALADHKVVILIGPEGDFSEREIEEALDNNYFPVTLGENRLRTETAAIVACHTVALINQ